MSHTLGGSNAPGELKYKVLVHMRVSVSEDC